MFGLCTKKIFFKLNQLLGCFIKARGKSDNSVSGIE